MKRRRQNAEAFEALPQNAALAAVLRDKMLLTYVEYAAGISPFRAATIIAVLRVWRSSFMKYLG